MVKYRQRDTHVLQLRLQSVCKGACDLNTWAYSRQTYRPMDDERAGELSGSARGPPRGRFVRIW